MSSSTVWSYTIPTVEAKRSKPVKQRRMAEWWRGSTSHTPSVHPALKSETLGSRPSGWTTCTLTDIYTQICDQHKQLTSIADADTHENALTCPLVVLTVYITMLVRTVIY